VHLSSKLHMSHVGHSQGPISLLVVLLAKGSNALLSAIWHVRPAKKQAGLARTLVQCNTCHCPYGTQSHHQRPLQALTEQQKTSRSNRGGCW
jgi:hypothetical protein